MIEPSNANGGVCLLRSNYCFQEQCICGKCGKPTVVIGYETAEQLDREPAKYFVRVLKREKRACSSWHKEESRRQPCRLELLRRASSATGSLSTRSSPAEWDP